MLRKLLNSTGIVVWERGTSDQYELAVECRSRARHAGVGSARAWTATCFSVEICTMGTAPLHQH